MMTLQLSEVAAICGGELVGSDGGIRGLVHDSRRVAPGNLFAALPGERVDGHDYLDQARTAGAGGALVSRATDVDMGQVRVADVRAAMGTLTAEWRRRMPARVVAVTGSNGKTTVKELSAAILARRGRVLATRGNYNNEIGLPLSVLQITPNTDVVVLEMGGAYAFDPSA